MFRAIAVPKFKGNRSVLSNVIECVSLTAVFNWNIPTFDILYENLNSDKDLKKRFMIITISCRNIIHMDYLLVRLLTEI